MCCLLSSAGDSCRLLYRILTQMPYDTLPQAVVSSRTSEVSHRCTKAGWTASIATAQAVPSAQGPADEAVQAACTLVDSGQH